MSLMTDHAELASMANELSMHIYGVELEPSRAAVVGDQLQTHWETTQEQLTTFLTQSAAEVDYVQAYEV